MVEANRSPTKIYMVYAIVLPLRNFYRDKRYCLSDA